MNVKMKNIAHSEVLTLKEQISYQEEQVVKVVLCRTVFEGIAHFLPNT